MNHALFRRGTLWPILVAGLTLAANTQAYTPVPGEPRPARVIPAFHPSTPSDLPKSDAEAARFLTMATFGPTQADVTLLRQIGYSAWIRKQLQMPVTLQRPYVVTTSAMTAAANNNNPGQTDRMEAWFNNTITAPDQLRQRIAWALSQIVVVSDQTGGLTQDPDVLAEFYDTLARDSTGYVDANNVHHPSTYANLLTDVTLSPAMAKMLSYLRNQKGDPNKGTSPDENYAREVMQLFSIGLVLLNPDGTPKLDANGAPIPTYNQTTITQYAKIFTGWSYTTGFNSNPANYANWSAAEYAPLICYDQYHDFGTKTLVSYSGNYGAGSDAIVIPANNSCAVDLQQGLATLTNHPNLAPFISKQLIQHFTTSNPTPAYVARVAATFRASGGDIPQTVVAILLDPEALSGTPSPGYPNYAFGKVREPLLRLTALWRWYKAAASNGLYTFNNPQTPYSQRPLGSPTVFNFYQTDYAAPGEISGSNLLVSPELQIFNETTVALMANDLTARSNAYVGNSSNTSSTIAIDISTLTAVSNDANALAEQINHDLLYGSMSASMKASLVKLINAIPATSAVTRAQSALQVTLTSPEFAIQK